MTDAPVAWIHSLHTKARLLAILVIPYMVSLMLINSHSGILDRWAGVVALLMGFAWLSVVWAITQQRPALPTIQQSPSTELIHIRHLARYGQFGWLGYVVLQLMAHRQAIPTLRIGALIVADIMMLVGVAGIAGLLSWLSHLARWARADNISIQMRCTILLIVPTTPSFMINAWLHRLLAPNLYLDILSMISFFLWLGYGVGLVLLVVSLFRFASLTAAARKDAQATCLRDIRALERIARKTFKGSAPAGSILDTLTRARGDAVLDPCANCGYDRTGLPDGAPCPECGHELEGSYVLRQVIPHHTALPTPAQSDPLPLVGDEDEYADED